MTKVYLLVYTKDLGAHETIKACLDAMPELVTSWRSEIPNTFFLVSNVEPRILGEAIIKCTQASTPRFVITEISDNKWGWLVKDSWDFIRHKGGTPTT